MKSGLNTPQHVFWRLSLGLGLWLGLLLVPAGVRAAAPSWTVLHESAPGATQVQLQWVVRSGSLDDGATKPGLAQFTARALLRGTTTRPYLDLTQALQAISATIRVETSHEWTRFIGEVPANRLDSFLHLMRDIVSNPEFDPIEMESLRRELISEMNSEKEQPESLMRNLVLKEFYSGTAAENPPEGTVEGISRITGLDLRQFFRRHYGVSNYILALVTPFDEPAVRLKLSQALRGIPEVSSSVQTLPPPRGQGLSAVVISDLSLSDLPFRVIFPGVAAQDPDRPGLELANRVFGGGPSSRLGRLEESFNGRLLKTFSGFDQLISVSQGAAVYALGGLVSRDSVQAVLPATVDLIRQFISDGISEAEYVKARDDQLAWVPGQLDSPEKRLNQRVRALLSGVDLLDLPGWQVELSRWDQEKVSARLRDRLSLSPAVVVVFGNPSDLVPMLQSIPGMGNVHTVTR